MHHEIKAKILSDKDVVPNQPGTMANIYGLLAMAAPGMFPIDLPIDYEPTVDKNIGALAAAANKDINDFMYDFLVQGNGDRFAILLGALIICIPIFFFALSVAWLRFHPKVGIVLLLIGLVVLGVILFINFSKGGGAGAGASHLLSLRNGHI